MTHPIDSAGRGVRLGCGGYVKPHFVDGYCGNGCDIAFEAGKAAGRREAMAEVAAEATRRAGDYDKRYADAVAAGDRQFAATRYTGRYACEGIAEWAESRALEAGAR